MSKKVKKEENSERILYWIIAILLFFVTVLIYLLYETQFKVKPVYQSVEVAYESGQLVNPVPLEKPEGVLRAEEDLKIVRNVSVDDSGYIVIEAYLNNVDRLEDGVTVQDLVETIRFGERVEILDGEVSALSGRLFPQGKSINLANWGTGPQSEKKTKINITVLDLNLDASIKDSVALYRVRFKPSVDFDVLYFDDVEMRYNEFIMSFGEEEMAI